MSLKYEPSSEPLHISVKQLTLCEWLYGFAASEAQHSAVEGRRHIQDRQGQNLVLALKVLPFRSAAV